MQIPFNELSNSSKIWIYQSNREFNNEEIDKINNLLNSFIKTWNNHGEGLKSSYTIKYNQFIVLAVDEKHYEASGCSIDSSVQIMKKIEKLFNVDLFDKMKTTFKIGDNINIISLSEFQKYVTKGKINSDTIVFNNMVNTIEEFKNNWEVKAKNSWHKRYF